MTIFMKVAEIFLIQGIERIQEISINNDNGLFNTIGHFTLFFKRQPDLSIEKRARLDTLKNQIKELLESEINDRENIDITAREALHNLITTCKHDLLEVCTAKQIGTGQTEIALTALQGFVAEAHEKICNYLQLRDVVIDDQYVNKLMYYAAFSCARSVFEKKVLPAATRLVLSNEKEQIILDSLQLAIELNHTTHESKALRPQLMKERAEHIQREVKKIDAHGSNQYLIEYMDLAIASFTSDFRPDPEQEIQAEQNLLSTSQELVVGAAVAPGLFDPEISKDASPPPSSLDKAPSSIQEGKKNGFSIRRGGSLTQQFIVGVNPAFSCSAAAIDTEETELSLTP